MDERAAGAVILSKPGSDGGYYLPGSKEEIQEYISLMTKQAKTIFISCRSARKKLQEIQEIESGQMKF